MSKKEKLYLGILAVLFLIGAILITLFLTQKPTFRFPKATGCNITGKWQVDTSITSPSSDNSQQLATLSQNSSGGFTGTLADPDGSNPTPISGTVSGNHFVTNPIPFSGTQMGFDYEGTMTLEGTISNSCNQINGTISGQVTKPVNESLSGTFAATRTEGPPPTTTPTKSSTPTATATAKATSSPTASGTPKKTATPTPKYTGNYSSNTPFPIPTTGSSQAINLDLIGAISLIIISLIPLIF